MNTHVTLSAALKDLSAMEILSVIAQAKTGDEEALANAPEGAVSDANEALEWLIEVLLNKNE